jgi:hypothetical protein
VLLVGSGGDGVRSFILRVDMTRSGSKGTSLAPWNPPWMLLGVIALLYAALKYGRNSALVMWLIWLCIAFLAWRLYASFKGAKQPILRGCRRCDE